MKISVAFQVHSIDYCAVSNMAEASVVKEVQSDSNCELKIKYSSKNITDLKSNQSHESDFKDCAMEDTEVAVGNTQVEYESKCSFKNIPNGIICDKSKKQEDMLDTTKVNGNIVDVSVLCNHEIDIEKHEPESQSLGPSISSKGSHHSSTDHTFTLLRPKQALLSSDIVSCDNKTGSNVTVPDINNSILSSLKSSVVESHKEKEIVSGFESTNTESHEEKEIVSGFESTNTESPEEKEIVSGFESTNAESHEEKEIVSGFESTNAESYEEKEFMSGFESANTESLEEKEIVSGFKSTNTESPEEKEVVSGFESANTESHEEKEILSGVQTTNAQSFYEEQIAVGLSSDSLHASKDIAASGHQECKEITDVESVSEPPPVCNKLPVSCIEDYERDPTNSRTISSEYEEEEDMQVDECEPLAKIEDCFTISETEMDCCVSDSEAANEAESNDMNERTSSVHKSACISLSDSCNILHRECEKSDDIQSQISPEQDVVSADGSCHVDSACEDITSDRTDADTYDIRTVNSMSVGGDVVGETVCLEESDVEHVDNKVRSTESSVNIMDSINKSDCEKDSTLLLNNYSEQSKHMNSTHSSGEEITDECTVENISENLDNMTSDIELKNQKVNTVLSVDKANHLIDTKVITTLPAKKEKHVITNCEVPDLCTPDAAPKTQIYEGDSSSTPKTEDQISQVQFKTKTNETLVSLCETVCVNDKLSDTKCSLVLDSGHIKDIETGNLLSQNATKSDIETLDNKESVDKKLEVQVGYTDTKNVKLDKVKSEEALKKEQKFLLSSKHETVTEYIDTDDEIIFVDETGESKPVEKYALKNILHMPKSTEDTNISNSKQDIIFVTETDGLNSPKTLTEEKPQTKSRQLINDHDEQSLEMTVSLVLDDNDENKEIDGNEDVQYSERNIGCGRKRIQEETEDGDFSGSKRSRLDLTATKIDDQCKEKPEDTVLSQVLESDDDDVIIAEEVPEAKIIREDTIPSTDDTPILLSCEALRNLIAIRVKAFIKSHKQANLEKLNIRTRGMQSASNLWRETAKHLEKSITELAAMNQKLEKHKAHSLAIKQLENRSVGIQVGEDKRSSISPVNGITNKKPETAPSSYLPPPVLPISSPQTPQTVRHQQVQSSNSSKPALRSSSFAIQSPAMRVQNRPGKPIPFSASLTNTPPQRPVMPLAGRMLQPQNIRPPVAAQSSKNVVNLIDLTDDDDSARNIVPKTQKYTNSQPGMPNVSKFVVGGKTTASGNGNMKPSSLQQGSANNIISSHGHSQQSAMTGSHHHTSSNHTTGVSANTQFQLVNIANPPIPRAFLALVPGLRPGAPTNTPSVATGRSNQLTNNRALQQNSAPAITSPVKTNHTLPPSFHIGNKHPAPLPSCMDTGNAPATAKRRPPKPGLKISRVSQGIVLSWNMPSLHAVEKITSYQLFAYQESDSVIPRSSLWKKVGDVKALPLPMACTLTQFQEGNKYHFAVRAVDQYGRCGSYSDPSSIFLGPKT